MQQRELPSVSSVVICPRSRIDLLIPGQLQRFWQRRLKNHLISRRILRLFDPCPGHMKIATEPHQPQFRAENAVLFFAPAPTARTRRMKLQRFLQRAAIPHCLVEIRLGCLEIMSAGDPLSVADPPADHMDRKILQQFSLAGRAEVLPDLGRGFESCTFDEPDKLRVRIAWV